MRGQHTEPHYTLPVLSRAAGLLRDIRWAAPAAMGWPPGKEPPPGAPGNRPPSRGWPPASLRMSRGQCCWHRSAWCSLTLRSCPGWRGETCWAGAWRPGAMGRGRGGLAWGACQVWHESWSWHNTSPGADIQALGSRQTGFGKKHVVCSFIGSCCWTIQSLSKSEPNCCFSLIYKVFMGAFNLYNPEYLSLLYNIYFTFLFRGVFKKVSRKFSEIGK